MQGETDQIEMCQLSKERSRRGDTDDCLQRLVIQVQRVTW